jgi:hypothetical protein
MAQPGGDISQERSLPTRTLEALPTEVLVAILSAARSPADLYAFIQASPRLYQVFKPVKQTVLLNIVHNDLGTALRDAVAAVLLTLPGETLQLATYVENVAEIIRRYEELPRGGAGLAAARGLPWEVVIELIRLNRTVQFLMDEFAASRLPELRKIDPDAAGPLTGTERRRLSRALLRHQVVAHIEYGYFRLRLKAHLPPEMAIMHRFVAHFRPWETQQLADVHSFVSDTVWCTSPSPLVLDTSPNMSPRIRRLQVERGRTLRDLRKLHRDLVREQAARATATSPIPVPIRTGTSWMVMSATYGFLGAGPLPAEEGHRYRVAGEFRGLRDELYRREDALPPLVHDEHDDSSPPFAWVDAHGGLDCQRWGCHVRREVASDSEGNEDTTARQRIWMRETLEKWRWLGFVFWDRARVERLKTRMPGYETGWLKVAPPSEEWLTEYYNKLHAQSEQATRPRRRRGGT